MRCLSLGARSWGCHCSCGVCSQETGLECLQTLAKYFLRVFKKGFHNDCPVKKHIISSQGLLKGTNKRDSGDEFRVLYKTLMKHVFIGGNELPYIKTPDASRMAICGDLLPGQKACATEQPSSKTSTHRKPGDEPTQTHFHFFFLLYSSQCPYFFAIFSCA